MGIAHVCSGLGTKIRGYGISDAWFHLLLGMVIAPVAANLPLLGLMCWFLAALVHEMGHAGAAWLVGVPAVPALGITAEAATVLGDQLWPLTVLVWGGLVWGAFRVKGTVIRCVAFGLLGTVYPVLCFGGVREAWQLVSGHVGELGIGGVFVWRALKGGVRHNPLERGLYAVMGWFLVGRNVLLTAGLVFSAEARAEYGVSGSYGLENDYVRLAEILGVSVEMVAGGMTGVGLMVVPGVVGVWCWRGRGRGSGNRRAGLDWRGLGV